MSQAGRIANMKIATVITTKIHIYIHRYNVIASKINSASWLVGHLNNASVPYLVQQFRAVKNPAPPNWIPSRVSSAGSSHFIWQFWSLAAPSVVRPPPPDPETPERREQTGKLVRLGRSRRTCRGSLRRDRSSRTAVPLVGLHGLVLVH